MFYELFEPNYRLIQDYIKKQDLQPAMAEGDGSVPYIPVMIPEEATSREVALRVVQ